ncbi:hypothetical protein PHYBLDRAFT_69509 [Phycomyces blakesleeanus NRRL 1555(-)]|uniref:Uncharacterized protein n=1 Tax=Phycomyces blakesleeanus (strain ATCC 8743b / DSM 1359 / FGSC 10004 / NBRC 33097 / NRRL 1555) TaxID=763407 RepID=A0A162TSA2_PHYB8|nr:hypothetical protein PHYBLDRAFT_69509 [Phycomyces blakesleeanus NRRL 1555(-)]OAD70652.1 hypothetical protein PHYBLDRAFT_69509 [Phycomyces blakesleeanus NRRL 1555(-)]|eukprot:XP_018288692.1 hypothetical protein PHYBLDRAFT_69509 [Phycomyces blakesleeanus NRRL 1555(-)]
MQIRDEFAACECNVKIFAGGAVNTCTLAPMTFRVTQQTRIYFSSSNIRKNHTVKARYSDMDGGQKFYHYHYIERVFFLLHALFSDISNAAYKNKLRARYSDNKEARTQIFQKIITISRLSLYRISLYRALTVSFLMHRKIKVQIQTENISGQFIIEWSSI